MNTFINGVDSYFESIQEDSNAYINKLVCICESADNAAVGKYYLEAGVGQTISDAFKKIIANIKAFIEKVVRSLESAKIKAMLKIETSKAKLKIKWRTCDIDLAKNIAKINKIYNKHIIEIRKIYNQYMSGKMDAKTAKEKMDDVYSKYNDYIDNTPELTYATIINSTIMEIQEVRASLINLNNLQDQIVQSTYEQVKKDIEKLEKEAKTTRNASNVLLNLATTMSKLHRKHVQKVTSTCGVKSKVLKFRKSVDAVTESTNKNESADIDDIMSELDLDESYFEQFDMDYPEDDNGDPIVESVDDLLNDLDFSTDFVLDDYSFLESSDDFDLEDAIDNL